VSKGWEAEHGSKLHERRETGGWYAIDTRREATLWAHPAERESGESGEAGASRGGLAHGSGPGWSQLVRSKERKKEKLVRSKFFLLRQNEFFFSHGPRRRVPP